MKNHNGSRTNFIFKNVGVGVASKIITLLINFVSRTVFIYYLGASYLGINGLYSEILQLLNLSELGVGSALTFSLYAPVAHNDRKRSEQIILLYKKIYRIISVVILALGLLLLPFLQYIVRGADSLSLRDLRLYFIFYLLNTIISYLCAEKYSYLTAMQIKYKTIRIDTIVNITVAIVQLAVLFVAHSFILYLAVQTLTLLVSKFLISVYLNKQYPILTVKKQEPIEKEYKRKLFQEVRSLAIHKFSSVAVHATDNIIISAFTGLGVVLVGYISNYNLIINSITGFISIIFNSMTASFGNLIASSSKNHFRKSFLEVNFLNFWIYGFSSIAFFVLIPPFIRLWIGENYLIDQFSFLLIILNCYMQGQSVVYNCARDACGSFHLDKWLSVFQAIINLVVSIVCAYWFGLVGVYVGTVASRVFYIAMKPMLTYEFMFDSPKGEYYAKLIRYFCYTLIAGALTYCLSQAICFDNLWVDFAYKLIVVMILPNLVFLICSFRSDEFLHSKARILSILKRT